MPDLEARLARLEAANGILRTLHRYGHLIDAGEEAAWVDLFTPDGTFELRGPRGGGFAIAGEAELRDFVARYTRRPAAQHEHVTALPVVELDEHAAAVTSRFFVLVVADARPVVQVFGTYRDRLVRGDDGAWRFAHRLAEVDAVDRDLASLVRPR